jgi:predicted GH43/DUF377 family glycosyl hydrolase
MFDVITSLPQCLHAIDNRKLAPGLRHYNASIVAWAGGHLMAYRRDNTEGKSSVLLQPLTKKLQPAAKIYEPLVAHTKSTATEHEDPRLFVVGGKLFLAYVELNGRHRDGLFTQELVRLDEDFTVAQRYELHYGRNGAKAEKNWIWFDAGQNRIGAVYSLAPHRVALFSAVDGSLLSDHITAGIDRWLFGSPHGGTPALLCPSLPQSLTPSYLHFWHSYVPQVSRQRRYGLSAAVFSAAPPYGLIAVSAKPIVWASEYDRAIVNPRRPGWNPLCIFPAGLAATADGWLVSVGINDSLIALLRLTPTDLDLVEPHKIAANLALSSESPSLPLSHSPTSFVRVRVTPKPGGYSRRLAEPGGPYTTGEEFLTTPERAAALGPQVLIL